MNLILTLSDEKVSVACLCKTQWHYARVVARLFLCSCYGYSERFY